VESEEEASLLGTAEPKDAFTPMLPPLTMGKGRGSQEIAPTEHASVCLPLPLSTVLSVEALPSVHLRFWVVGIHQAHGQLPPPSAEG
jgi:hypothetical protein